MASRSEALQTQMRKNPRGVFRVFFFVLIWTLALANVVIVAGEFQRSLPFVIGLGPPRRRGIEDSRRQAFPVITASCIILLIGIPIAVGLPLFGVALFFSLYIVEALWTGLVMILTLGKIWCRFSLTSTNITLTTNGTSIRPFRCPCALIHHRDFPELVQHHSASSGQFPHGQKWAQSNAFHGFIIAESPSRPIDGQGGRPRA